MKDQKNEFAYCIVDFWHTVEFLTQSNFPEDTRENKAIICEIKNKKGENKSNKWFTMFSSELDVSVEQLLALDNADFIDYPLYGEIYACVGKVKREALIKELYTALGAEDDRPEEDKSKICLIGFKVGPAGTYIRQSLQVSPIVWGVYRCAQLKEITREAYDKEQ